MTWRRGVSGWRERASGSRERECPPGTLLQPDTQHPTGFCLPMHPLFCSEMLLLLAFELATRRSEGAAAGGAWCLGAGA